MIFQVANTINKNQSFHIIIQKHVKIISCWEAFIFDLTRDSKKTMFFNNTSKNTGCYLNFWDRVSSLLIVNNSPEKRDYVDTQNFCFSQFQELSCVFLRNSRLKCHTPASIIKLCYGFIISKQSHSEYFIRKLWKVAQHEVFIRKLKSKLCLCTRALEETASAIITFKGILMPECPSTMSQ